MREARRTIFGLKQAGQEAASERIRYRHLRKEYERFSEAMGVLPDWARVYVDNLHKLGS